MRKVFILLLLSSIADSSSAQINDSIRSIYVERFPDYFFVWPVFKQRNTTFEVSEVKNRGNNIAYKSNSAYGLGFGVYLFEIGAEVTFSVPVVESKNELFGETKATDLQVNLLSRRWGGDLFYQRYRGFYVADANGKVNPGSPYPQRPDMVTENFGVNGILIFNKNKFSLRSAYNFAERQRKSAGSFVLSGTINSFQMKADSAIFDRNQESIYGTSANISEFNSFTISVSPGYTHTFVWKNLFFNGLFSIGPAFRNIDYLSRDLKHHTSSGVDFFVDFRIAGGYNGERFFTGLSFVSQSRAVNLEPARLTSTNGTIKFLFGYRFQEFGIFKKRAVDFIPFRK